MVVAAILLAGCADEPDPRPGGPPPADPAGAATTTTSITVPTTTTTAASPSTATTPANLDIQSSDEQRCAIAAEAGVDLEGCPG